MSKTLIDNKCFIILFLETSKQQRRVLFDTLTNTQILVITEICYNLLKLELTDSIQQVIKKRKKILQKLTNSRYKIKTKKTIIVKHYKQISEILLLVKEQLLQLII